MRWLLGILGALLGAYGALQLFSLGLANLGWTVAWMAVAVVVHDFLLAPTTLGISSIGTAALPGRPRRIAVRWFLIVGTVTTVAIPVLSGQGVRADNPSLLDRNYVGGWLVFVVISLLVIVATDWLATVRKDRHGQHLGR